MKEQIKLKDILKKTYTVEANVTMNNETTVVSQNRDEKVGLDLTIGVFFDGTQNNMYNTLARIKKTYSGKIRQLMNDKEELSADSYKNDYSNVAKLWGLYTDDRTKDVDKRLTTVTFPVYVEGIGTLRETPDEMLPGVALGVGDRGVTAKVKDGCKLISEDIKDILKDRENTYIKSIKMDVFGFSRGSAAARHFINEVTIVGRKFYILKKGDTIEDERSLGMVKQDNIGVASKNKLFGNTENSDSVYKKTIEKDLVGYINSGGILGKFLEENSIRYVYPIEVNFVGLFDTVASTIHIVKDTSKLGLIKAWTFGSGWDLSGANNDEGDINMYLKPGAANKVVHLVAKDEHRLNFPLTAIGEGETIKLPGVHSDIGGGYTHNAGEKVSFAHADNNSERISLQVTQKQILTEGWYECEDDLKIQEFSYQVEDPGRFGEGSSTMKTKYHYTLYGQRASISTEYSFIPLQIMKEKAIKSGVPFKKPTDEGKSYGFEYNLRDPRLKQLKAKFDQQIAAKRYNVGSLVDEISWLRKEYIHQSSNIDPMFGAVGHEPLGLDLFLATRPAPNKKRIIHPNQPKD